MFARAPALSDESGFSLVELLVAMAMLTGVLGSVLMILASASVTTNDDVERTHAIRTAQVEVDALVREARAAFRVNGATATRLDVTVHRAGQTQRVAFDCSAAHPTLPGLKRCLRQELATDGTVVRTSVAVDRLTTGSVFTYLSWSGSVQYVEIAAEVPAAGERPTGRRHEILLRDGFEIRNHGVVP